MDERARRIYKELEAEKKRVAMRTFREVKGRMLEALSEPKLTQVERRIDGIMRQHLAGYTGVIAHGTWRDLRSALSRLLNVWVKRAK